MKATVIILIASILLCSALNAQSTCRIRSTAVVRDSSVGPLALGMPFSDVLRRCRVVKDTVVPNDDFAEPERVLVVNLGLDMVTVGGSISPLDTDQAAQRIARIYVDGPTLTTKDSLRVGMTLGELRRYKGLTGGVSEASTCSRVAP